MKQYDRFHLITTITVLLLLSSQAWAGIDPPIVKTLEGNKGQIKVDSFTLVEDAKFFDINYFNTVMRGPYPVKNIISLEFNEEANLPIPQ
ncbi:MAG TPA: hypothetical protein VM187_11290, partial [Niastella sp.]|nr:hypothetical protein [Niastella sp.]